MTRAILLAAVTLLVSLAAIPPAVGAPRLPSDPSYRIPVVNQNGDHLFVVYLAEDAANNENSEGEAPARPTSHRDNWKDHKGWHRPPARALVKRLDEFDLGTGRTLTSIRLTPEQFPSGSATHQIYVGNAPSPTTLVQTISGNGATLEPFAATLSGTGRYVRVHTSVNPSWVSWREIEIYGY